MYKQNWGLNPWWLEPTWTTKSDWGIAQGYWGPSHVVFSGPSSKWCSINAFPDTRGRFCADSLTNGLSISQHESPLPNQLPDVSSRIEWVLDQASLALSAGALPCPYCRTRLSPCPFPRTSGSCPHLHARTIGIVRTHYAEQTRTVPMWDAE